MKAVDMELPNLRRVQCWNHLFRDIQFWLRKNGAPASDITVYIDDIAQLFHSPSEQVYKQKYSIYLSSICKFEQFVRMRYTLLERSGKESYGKERQSYSDIVLSIVSPAYPLDPVV